MQCWKSHVEVHMYVLQYMHEYTVNIDDTLISNLMYLLLVLLKLNISTCYWCSFLRINTLGQSKPNDQGPELQCILKVKQDLS